MAYLLRYAARITSWGLPCYSSGQHLNLDLKATLKPKTHGSGMTVAGRTDAGERGVGLALKGLALHPEPAAGEAAAPILLCVRGRVRKVVPLAAPLDPPARAPLRHQDLRAARPPADACVCSTLEYGLPLPLTPAPSGSAHRAPACCCLYVQQEGVTGPGAACGAALSGIRKGIFTPSPSCQCFVEHACLVH